MSEQVEIDSAGSSEAEGGQTRRPRSSPSGHLAARVGRFLLLLLAAIVCVGLTAWSALAIAFANHTAGSPRYLLAALAVFAVAAAVLFVRPRRYRWAAPVVLFVVVLTWFLSLKPSNGRDWSPEVARVASADIAGSRVIVHNVRNFDFRSETDFTPVWEDRTYDIDHVKSVDLILVYWGSKAIAHAIVSFGFDDGNYLAVSIETRKERGETYSAVQGFFRQFELVYVFADERDALKLRTNFRNEDVYLYHTRMSPEKTRSILLSYLTRANALARDPEWYNALISNCATGVIPHARAGGAPATWSIDVLLSGYAAQQAYRNGNLDNSLPFAELESRSRINESALAAGKASDFSQRIRTGLPVPAVLADGNPG